MPARQRPTEIAAVRARAAVLDLARNARDSRILHGISQDDVSRAIGISRSRYSRIERGLAPQLSIIMAARILAVVGLDLSVRVYPGGEPLRDRAHAAVLSGVPHVLHPALRWNTEVPLPIAGDRRAWDGMITGFEPVSREPWRFGVECEVRPTDLQAVERRLALKERDGGVDGVLLLLADTRHNRHLVRLYASSLRERFPVPAADVLADLAAGRRPRGNAIILIPGAGRAPACGTERRRSVRSPGRQAAAACLTGT